MKPKIRTMAMVILLAATAAIRADPQEVRFLGGSYDGWDRNAMDESMNVWLPKGALIMFR